MFGVPTVVVRGELFWGSDTIAWMNAFVDDPEMFGRGEMSRAAQNRVRRTSKTLRNGAEHLALRYAQVLKAAVPEWTTAAVDFEPWKTARASIRLCISRASC